MGLQLSPYISAMISVAIVAGLCTDGIAAMMIRLPMFSQAYLDMGVDAGALRRLLLCTTQTFDSLPHAQATAISLGVFGLNHKQATGICSSPRSSPPPSSPFSAASAASSSIDLPDAFPWMHKQAARTAGGSCLTGLANRPVCVILSTHPVDKRGASFVKNNAKALTPMYIILVPVVLVVVLLNSGLLQRLLPAAQVRGTSYRANQYNYYYFSAYRDFLNTDYRGGRA